MTCDRSRVLYDRKTALRIMLAHRALAVSCPSRVYVTSSGRLPSLVAASAIGARCSVSSDTPTTVTATSRAVETAMDQRETEHPRRGADERCWHPATPANLCGRGI